MPIRYLIAGLNFSLCLMLSGCGGDPIEKLVSELDSADAVVRRSAVHTILEKPVGDARVMAALAKCVADSDAEARYFAIDALGRIGPAAKPSIGELKKAMQDAEPRVRLRAALSIARIDAQEPSFLPVITNSMREGDGNTLLEIGAMGPSAVWAVPTLAELVSHPMLQVRVLALHDLGRIGPGASSALPALQNAMRDSNPAVKQAAEKAAKQIHTSSAGG